MSGGKTKDSIKRTGELLLSGWKLLNTACPVCNTALLSKGDNLRCPMCDLPVVTEANQANVGKSENLPSPPAVNKVESKIDEEYELYASEEKSTSTFQSLEEVKKEYDAQNKRMDQISNKLGEKMLAGYALLNTICPQPSCRGTPLVRLAGAPMMCVACDREYLTSPLGDLIPKPSSGGEPAARTSLPAAPRTPLRASTGPNTTATATAAPAASAAAAPAASAAARDVFPSTVGDDASFFLDMRNAPILNFSHFATNANDTSAKISRRLMQGWALLDKCCQGAQCKGEVPLMRDLEGKEVCVECSTTSTAAAISTTAAPSTAAASGTQQQGTQQGGKVTLPARSTRNRVVSEDEYWSQDSDSKGRDGGPAPAAAAASTGAGRHADSGDGDSYSDSEAEAELWQEYLASRQQQHQQQQKQQKGDKQQDQKQSKLSAQGQTAPGRGAVRMSVAAVSPADGDGAAGAEVVEGALSVLHQKLHAVTQELASCSSTRRIGELADVLAKLSAAIKSTRELQG